MSNTLPTWRRSAQTPALIFAIIGLCAAGIVIFTKLSAPSYAQLQRAKMRLPAARLEPAFDFGNLTIPREEIRSGGPPKDGIPALTNPAIVAANEADFLAPTDPVIGVVVGDAARAYPHEILDMHEIVNDTLDGAPIAVTYCPLCDSSVVFDRQLGDRTIELGVSGLLYTSNVLMYDRGEPGAEGLWSQMAGKGVSGSTADAPLRRLPLEVCSWESWLARYPQTSVLSNQTGYARRYDRSVYAGYFSMDRLMFPIGSLDDRLPAKTPVVGVMAGGAKRAYWFDPKQGQFVRGQEELGGVSFELVVDQQTGAIRIENAQPGVEVVYTFWFAWAAFHPETELVLLSKANQS